MPCEVYLDDIAVYGDTREEVLETTAEAIRRLAAGGFMINLKKTKLCCNRTRILGHTWFSGGYWEPEATKLEALLHATDEELEASNRSSVYGLLNFYREYVPHFSELTEPIRLTLSSDAKPWTDEATKAVRTTLQKILRGPRWLNFDPEEELRVETRLSPGGLAIVLL